MLDLFSRVVHFNDATGFNGYIESVEMYNYYKSILPRLITDRVTYLCEKYKIPKRADGSTWDCMIIWMLGLEGTC